MDDLEALVQQGDALRAAGHYAEAVAAYDAVLARDLENTAARRGRALALQRTHRPAVAAPPHDPVERWLRRAAAFDALDRPAQALAAYDAALALDPVSGAAWAGKARAHRLLGDLPAAEAAAIAAARLAGEP